MKTDKRSGAGVIVGRFQVPEFHAGHHEITTRVLRKHHKVLFVIGVTPDKNPDSHDPLSYAMRAQAIQSQYPNILVCPLQDQPSDEVWSKNLDLAISTHFPAESITLYGSRDSFISHYSGKYNTQELEPIEDLSGTEVRNSTANEIVNSVDFRKGVIYSTMNRFPIVYPVVDIALVRESGDGHEILLGKKLNEVLWRLPGGFIDASKDSCVEDAVFRELNEETNYLPLLGQDTSDIKFVCSSIIHDRRYRNGNDCLMTFFYMVKFQKGSGPVKAGDDLNEVGWHKLNEGLIQNVATNHKSLIQNLISKLEDKH